MTQVGGAAFASSLESFVILQNNSYIHVYYTTKHRFTQHMFVLIEKINSSVWIIYRLILEINEKPNCYLWEDAEKRFGKTKTVWESFITRDVISLRRWVIFWYGVRLRISILMLCYAFAIRWKSFIVLRVWKWKWKTIGRNRLQEGGTRIVGVRACDLSQFRN